jgi:hypothetical protein
MSQVTLLHDWDIIVLRGSGSTSVAVKNVFFPNERIDLKPPKLSTPIMHSCLQGTHNDSSQDDNPTNNTLAER